MNMLKIHNMQNLQKKDTQDGVIYRRSLSNKHTGNNKKSNQIKDRIEGLILLKDCL